MESLSKYLGEHFLSILPVREDGMIDWKGLALMGPIGAVWSWGVINVFPIYTTIASTVPITVIFFLWCLDMVFGLLASLIQGDGEGRTGIAAFSWKKWKQGMGKFVLWGLALGITLALRKSGAIGASLFAGVVEAYIIFAESGSALKNLGRLWGHQGIHNLGALAENRGDNLTLKKEDK